MRGSYYGTVGVTLVTAPGPGRRASRPRVEGVPQPVRAPASLLVAFVLLVLEAGALAALGVGLAGDVLTGAAAAVGTSAALAVFYLAVAAGLVAAGRALLRGRRWARAPVVTWQLLQGASALAVGSLFAPWVVVALLAAAVGVVAGVLWPASRAHLDRGGVLPD